MRELLIGASVFFALSALAAVEKSLAVKQENGSLWETVRNTAIESYTVLYPGVPSSPAFRDFRISPFTDPAAQLAISTIRCWIAWRIPTRALEMDTRQKTALEKSRIVPTIRIIFVERLFLNFMDHTPSRLSAGL